MSRQPISLGHTILTAHGLGNERIQPVIQGNYVNPKSELALPYPVGDWYLAQSWVPAAREGEVVICNTLIEGLLAYYQQIGLVSQKTTVVEVEPQHDQGFGFPATDPLSRTEEAGGVFTPENGDKPVLISAFNGSNITQIAHGVHLDTLNRPPSEITNNKARFRQMAEYYGYNVLPGTYITNTSDLNHLAQRFASPHGAWIKYPCGSGGDLNIHIPEVTADNISEAIISLRNTVARHFQEGIFEDRLENLWPESELSPAAFPLVIESDARNLGTVIQNGSSQFVVYRHGEVDIFAHSTQLTSPQGEYLGNTPFTPTPEEFVQLSRQVNGAARLNYYDGQFGIAGVDWFKIRHNGRDAIYLVELNSRPTAFMPAWIIADKIGAQYWVNTNAYTAMEVVNISDFIALVGEKLAYGNSETGFVYPQAFRTLVTRRGIQASPNFKIILGGQSWDHCQQISSELESRGISFTPGK